MVLIPAGSGAWPTGMRSGLPRIGVCPVCSPVINDGRDGAHTVLPAEKSVNFMHSFTNRSMFGVGKWVCP